MHSFAFEFLHFFPETIHHLAMFFGNHVFVLLWLVLISASIPGNPNRGSWNWKVGATLNSQKSGLKVQEYKTFFAISLFVSFE